MKIHIACVEGWCLGVDENGHALLMKEQQVVKLKKLLRRNTIVDLVPVAKTELYLFDTNNDIYIDEILKYVPENLVEGKL